MGAIKDLNKHTCMKKTRRLNKQIHRQLLLYRLYMDTLAVASCRCTEVCITILFCSLCNEWINKYIQKTSPWNGDMACWHQATPPSARLPAWYRSKQKCGSSFWQFCYYYVPPMHTTLNGYEKPISIFYIPTQLAKGSLQIDRMYQ